VREPVVVMDDSTYPEALACIDAAITALRTRYVRLQQEWGDTWTPELGAELASLLGTVNELRLVKIRVENTARAVKARNAISVPTAAPS
jgi:hypothetical protein